jgi:hypothetical protein
MHDAVRGLAALRLVKDIAILHAGVVLAVAVRRGCTFSVGVLLALLQAADFLVHPAVRGTFARRSVQSNATHELQ